MNALSDLPRIAAPYSHAVMTHHWSQPTPPPSAFEQAMGVFETLSSFAILVAAASLGFAAWAYRSNRRATDSQGLYLDMGRSITVTQQKGKPDIRHFEPTATAAGPGVRFSARTIVWHGDKRMKSDLWASDIRGRFDLDSTPLHVDLEIPVDVARDAWFGVAWEVVHGRGIRTQFVRGNLTTDELQVWKWYPSMRLHRWWCEQTWLRVLGAGTKRQSGRWKTISGDTTAEWQFPW